MSQPAILTGYPPTDEKARAQLSDYPNRRRFSVTLVLLPILGALMGAAAAGVATVSFAASYSSTAVVQLHETTTEIPAGAVLGLSLQPEEIVASNIQILESAAILQPVVEVTQYDTVKEVRKHFSAVRARNSDIVRITGSGETAQEAQALTNAIVESYVTYVRADEVERISEEIAAIDNRIAELEAASADPASIGLTEEDLENLVSELTSLAEQRRIELDLTSGGVQVIDDGNLPASRTRSLVQVTLLGGFLGFAVGMSIAILVWLWPRRPRDDEAPQASGLLT